MHKSFFKLILIIIMISSVYMQSCQDNCGSGSLQEYFDGLAECVCSLDCAGYGEACCDYYDECYQNPTNLEFDDFIGTWSGNIINNQTWSYDDPINIVVESNGKYTVTNNPGGHLVSDLYPGTEEIYYNQNTNILTFRWVNFYHYSCGGACYTGVYFQVMEYENGEMILFYNNGSGPAPQANSMFLSLDDECIDGEVNNDNPCNPMECYNGEWVEIVIDCAEFMGVPCYDGEYVAPPEDVCCSTCVRYGDINGDSEFNVNDIILLISFILDNDVPTNIEFASSDVNNDGIVDIIDVVLLVNKILN